MAKTSDIGWTDATFSPWWGCVKVSPACTNCYAEAFAKRVGQRVWGINAPRRFFGDKHWAEPLKWNRQAEKESKRMRVFCASMADVFEDRSDMNPHRARLWDLIGQTPNLDWLLLTKRPHRVHELVPPRWMADGFPTNVWMGTTVESPDYYERIEALVDLPARIRFLSCEPLLARLGDIDLLGISWLIAGGESGPRPREMRIEWLHELELRCVLRGIPLFVKQDSGRFPGRQGRIPDEMWARKEIPEVRP